MNNTKKLTVSAITVALSVVLMILGAVFEPLDLAVACIASVLVAFVYIEIGSPYTWLVWLCTSLLSALVYSASLMWIFYLFVFGAYPMVKGYVERLPRALWLPLKLLFAAATYTILYLTVSFVLGVELVSGELFGLPTWVVYLLTALLALIAFVAYDVFLTAGIRLYLRRMRPKIKNLLK